MLKYGIKIWSTNKKWFKEAFELFKANKIDFIELYIVPHSFLLEELAILKNIPTTLHTPHEEHHFNLFELSDIEIEIFKNQVQKTADFFNSPFIILHAGIGQDKENFKKNIKKIFDKRILIENMPKVSLNGRICFGYSLAQLQFIKKDCKFNPCLDFGHAAKSAFSQKLDYREFISSLISKLNPSYFHISGCNTKEEKDEHLNLAEGDFNIVWAKKILTNLAKNQNIYLVFEVPRGQGLENDVENICYFNTL